MKVEIEWNEKYILEYLPTVGEQDWMEFKRAEVLDFSQNEDKNKKNIAKEISAIANSGGGYIVFGIDNASKKILNGGVDKNIKNGTKEWLENIVPGLVDPPLMRFNIIEIFRQNDTSEIEEGKGIYIVNIEDSEQAPHQSKIDKIYYTRSGSHSYPASHQTVLDILGRRKTPKFEISFYFAWVNKNQPNRYVRSAETPVLVTELTNIGGIYAQFVNVILHIPTLFLNEEYRKEIVDDEFIDNRKYKIIVRENVINETRAFDGKIIGREPGRYTPILPGRKDSFAIPLINDSYALRDIFEPPVPIIKYEFYADNMPAIVGEIRLDNIKRNENLPYN